jgi:SAM-dependent methyltransferase
MTSELKKCPLCQSEKFAPAYIAKDRHYGISGSYRIVRCVACSLMFLSPMYSDEELSALYPVDYYAYQNNFSRSRWKEIVKKSLVFRIGTRDPHFESPGRLLDLGCGAGRFLHEMRDKGWDAYGVEISSLAAELGRKKAGLNIFTGTLQQAGFPSGFFDYVRANHSFEHISCPSETLEEIRRIMRPGGRLLIGVPNADGLNARIFRQYWWYLGAPVHPFTYSIRTLPQLLERHHFDAVRVTYNSDFTGLLGSCQILANRKNGRKSTEGALINNLVLRLLSHWMAKCVDLFRAGDAIEVVAAKGGDQL